ncbi:phospholipase A2 inhibitor 25 kDa subunit-like isoform X1 [Lacerta agilis]|uniref:phospholipase A2 inhibitor 25 kDa subunit-like isoform X1 n=1 Tax=Lacerta agilis TaxID=80427 RepID=UPI0014196B1C|nr:phospholipase A2 inhibitor 25 kDa subunit-like isoform X1 [Lacerta agilis]
MKIFLSTCLFLAILSEGEADICHIHKPGEKNSNENCVTSKGGSCFVHYNANNLNGSLKNESESGCTTNCTSENYSFTSEDGRFFRSFRSCCRYGKCTQLFIKKLSRKLNGRECPTCCPAFSKACKGSKAIKCHNDETQCAAFVVAYDDIAIPEKDFYGCASPSFCALAKKSKHSDALSGTITRARCSDTLRSLKQLNYEG